MVRLYMILMPGKPSLSPDEILKAEYDYIAQTVFQTNEDRSRVTSFYLVTFSSFIAALVTYQFNISPEQAKWIPWGFACLFIALAFMGLMTVLQLARLRNAWFDSVAAMNQIKDYYIENFKGLEKAFAWRKNSAPDKFKLNSVGFMLVVQVALLSGAAFGVAVFLFIQAVTGANLVILALLGGLAYFFFLADFYRSQLQSAA